MASSSAARSRLGCLFISALAGLLGGLASILFIAALRGRDPSPEMTPAVYAAARQRWEEQGPASYNIEIQVVGRQPATYRVEVRAREVVSATIDGRSLKQRRTFDTWSVPGMFGTMDSDVEHVQAFAVGKATRDTPRLTLRATFDPTYGYPQRYRRIEWGTDRDMTWEVREFNVLDDK